MNRPVTVFSGVLLLVVLAQAVTAQTPTTTSISYHGQLLDGGEPANGVYSMTFTLWDDEFGGTELGFVADPGVPVVDGLFTTWLDFGTEPFDGELRWLELTVEATTLSPRQPITPAPYALTAGDLVTPATLTSDTTPTLYVSSTAESGNALEVYADPAIGTGQTALRATHLPTGNNVKLGMPAAGVYTRVNTGSALLAEQLTTGNSAWLGTSTYGVRGLVTDPSDWAGYFEGRTYFSDNVGIGTESPGELLTVSGVVESLAGGFKFPDGTVQTTAATGGSGGVISSAPPASRRRSSTVE